jgi:hypothetical protein
MRPQGLMGDAPPSLDTGQTPVSSSATAAAGAMAPALPAVAGKTNYICGFVITGGGATAASVITATLAGIVGGTMSFNIAVPAGVTAGIVPLVVTFPRPLAASDVNVALTLSVPSMGTGNTNAASLLWGFTQ